MISLCEQCRNYDTRTMQNIIDSYRAVGLKRPDHIWCSATDRPEEIRFETCEEFKPYEPLPSKPRKRPAPKRRKVPRSYGGAQ